ncbi:GFA family protein [Pseudomonas sp. LB3P31]
MPERIFVGDQGKRTMKGSCACGSVGYEIDCIDMSVSHCHCHTCRKIHAAAMIVRLGTLDEDPQHRPQYHIWTEHEVPLLHADGLPMFLQWEPGR